ncbi:MAG: S41 family peptidase [Rikenellaceae bacterium]|nr:S41 family peptidase [Rikenellaceae bacterium]
MKRLLLLLAFVVAIGTPLSAQQDAETMRQLQKLVRAYRYMERYYVDTLRAERAVDGALTGMLQTLDPHSAYLSREAMEEVEVEMEGEFSGIGIEYRINRDTITVMNTVVGGPAEQVGMLPGDRILGIDTLNAVGMKQSEVPKHLRGKRGTKVDLTVYRRGVSELLHFTLTRDKIPLNTVDAAYMASERVGYIKLGRFGRTTVSEFREAYDKLGRPRRLILDLRGNGGGLLDQALGMAEFFLPKGSLLLTTEGRIEPEQRFYAREDGTMLTGRVAVLIDEVSASASEIVAGALQDWDRATIIGRTSFGKGLVQRQIPLGDGSAMRITTSRYLTPSGRAIQRPYEAGKRQAYYLDHLRGYADSITDATPRYRSLAKGRTIYGGGGIRPDLKVESDTTHYTNYYAQLVRRGILLQSVTDHLDQNREQLKLDYPALADFVGRYTPSPQLVEALKREAEKQGLTYREEEFKRSEALILTQLKALVAQRLYGVEGFYRVINPAYNEAYQTAMELLDK